MVLKHELNFVLSININVVIYLIFIEKSLFNNNTYSILIKKISRGASTKSMLF